MQNLYVKFLKELLFMCEKELFPLFPLCPVCKMLPPLGYLGSFSFIQEKECSRAASQESSLCSDFEESLFITDVLLPWDNHLGSVSKSGSPFWAWEILEDFWLRHGYMWRNKNWGTLRPQSRLTWQVSSWGSRVLVECLYTKSYCELLGSFFFHFTIFRLTHPEKRRLAFCSVEWVG